MLIDSETNLAVGDPERAPFPDPRGMDFALLMENIAERRRLGIASPSGIRQIFDATHGDAETDFTEGRGTEITLAARATVAAIAGTFADLLRRRKGASSRGPLRIVVGLDTRPTGPAIADVIIRMLLVKDVEVRYVFVAPVTKVVVYAREAADGFIYVSASHNPIGYNGLKLGFADGKILPPAEAYEFIAEYQAALESQDNIERVIAHVSSAPSACVQEVFDGIAKHRAEATEAYDRFCDCIVTGTTDSREAREAKALLMQQVRAMDLWVGLDPNGGARQDKRYLESWGFKVAEINGRPRVDMVHQLAPTPEATEQAQKELLRLQKEGKKIAAFFVFDTDGDRRNVVVPDGKGGVLVPDVQIIFALDILSAVADMIERGELTYNETGKPRQKVGIVVNGATTALIERIADRFGLILKRTESGEASVVKGGEGLTAQGVRVAMMGEGSNGSAFTLALLVREPVHTIRTIISLISRPSLVRILAEKLAGKSCETRHADWHRPEEIHLLISRMVALLPPSATTSLFTREGERRGATPASAKAQGLFKSNFDQCFDEIWPSKRAELAEGFVSDPVKLSREFTNYELDEELRGRGNRRTQTGGYKIEFFADADGRKRLVGWMWFRSSMTERGVTRRGASVVHAAAWENSPAAADLVHRKHKQLDALLTELLDEAERRTVRQILSEFPEDSEERKNLNAATGK